MEHKRHQAQGMINAKRVILDVAREFERMTGRGYGLIETYRMEDAECALVLIGSSAGTAKAAVERLRAAGKRVGLVKIRAFRPFPAEELAAALQNCGAVAVMDKCAGFSAAGGPLFAEVCAALYGAAPRPLLVSYTYGLGGRDVTVDSMERVFGELEETLRSGAAAESCRWLDVRG
ncbi:MAG: hypothetical protein ACLVL7_11310 [Anaerotruncus massiliensis (ex Togo et al. 2019)]